MWTNQSLLLSAVSTGQIWFDDVRVPREDMLDAYASVAPDGGTHSAGHALKLQSCQAAKSSRRHCSTCQSRDTPLKAAWLQLEELLCPAGTYSSPIANVGARFGTMVGGLTTGRMLIGQGAIDACKIGEQ